MTEQEENARLALAALAEEIVAELNGTDWADIAPGEWRVEPDPGAPRWRPSALLAGPEPGEQVRVELEGGRLLLATQLPQELHGFCYGKHREITVSAERGAPSIAKDLVRRLIRLFEPDLRGAWERKRGDEEREAERQRFMDDAAAVLAPLGDVRCGDPTDTYFAGRVCAGRYRAPVRVDLRVDKRLRQRDEAVDRPDVKAEVTLDRELLPRLVRALVALASPEPDRSLRAALAAQATDWERASEEWARDEVATHDDVEDDTMSECYGEAAAFLRKALAEHQQQQPPAEVWAVDRVDGDGVELFAGEQAARVYAAAHEAGEPYVLHVTSDEAAAEYMAAWNGEG